MGLSLGSTLEGTSGSAEPGDQPEHAWSNASALRWTLALLMSAGFLALVPLWAPLVLAAWSALLARPVHAWLARKVGGRNRAAGVVSVLLVVAALAPAVVVGLSLAGNAVQLAHKVTESKGVGDVLKTWFDAKPELALDRGGAERALEFAQQHGMGAMHAIGTVFGAATTAAVGSLVFLYAFYTFLVDGRRAYAWFLEHSPWPRAHTVRFASAFEETGRGLLISIGLTALIQGGLATIGYLIVGVPQALVFGLLSALASLIPALGTALVWMPLCAGLLLADRTGAAAGLLAVGVVVSTVDNFVRPALSRYGKLELPTFTVFVAMLGGVAAFGAGGLLLGPLFIRLAIEALRIARAER